MILEWSDLSDLWSRSCIGNIFITGIFRKSVNIIFGIGYTCNIYRMADRICNGPDLSSEMVGLFRTAA